MCFQLRKQIFCRLWIIPFQKSNQISLNLFIFKVKVNLILYPQNLKPHNLYCHSSRQEWLQGWAIRFARIDIDVFPITEKCLRTWLIDRNDCTVTESNLPIYLVVICQKIKKISLILLWTTLSLRLAAKGASRISNWWRPVFPN